LRKTVLVLVLLVVCVVGCGFFETQSPSGHEQIETEFVGAPTEAKEAEAKIEDDMIEAEDEGETTDTDEWIDHSEMNLWYELYEEMQRRSDVIVFYWDSGHNAPHAPRYRNVNEAIERISESDDRIYMRVSPEHQAEILDAFRQDGLDLSPNDSIVSFTHTQVSLGTKGVAVILKSDNIIDGVLFSECGSRLVHFANEQYEVYVIPQGVAAISEYAFSGFDLLSFNFSLREVILPEGLKTIETGAFIERPSLMKITFPDSLESIGEWAFAFCGDLYVYNLKPEVEVSENAFRDTNVTLR